MYARYNRLAFDIQQAHLYIGLKLIRKVGHMWSNNNKYITIYLNAIGTNEM